MAKDSQGNRLPWLKFWPVDFMADPAVQLLSWEQRGRYFWALILSWETDKPGTASSRLWGRWLGYTDAEWTADVEAIYAPLFERREGAWVQKRLVREYANAREDTDRRSAAGKKAAVIRWQSERNAVAMRQDMRTVCPPAPALEQQESTPSEQAVAMRPHPFELPEWVPQSAWADWLKFRGKRFSRRAQELSLRKLEALRAEGFQPTAVIEQSIERGWTGLFPLKGTNGNAPSSPSQPSPWDMEPRRG